MRRLVWTWALGATLGCGSDGSTTREDTSDANAGSSAVVYPDSHCDEQGCKKGGCDGDQSDEALPDCNAWEIVGHFALQAVDINPHGERGIPPPLADKRETDTCPGNSTAPEGVEGLHCCQRIAEQGAKPGYKLTGLSMHTPTLFSAGSVASTNKTAIEQDRYNWIMQLSSREPGAISVTSGLGLQNKDGSFAFADGPFEQGGTPWNQDGEWDSHEVEGTLVQREDGSFTLAYAQQYVPEKHGREFQLPMWGEGFDFTMLVLTMTGITMSISLDESLMCGGYVDPNALGKFDLKGKLKAYLPLESFRETVLAFKKGQEGLPLCPLTAQVKECDGPAKTWVSNQAQ